MRAIRERNHGDFYSHDNMHKALLHALGESHTLLAFFTGRRAMVFSFSAATRRGSLI
jgi:hypothetical protein